jgi:hypothetical protein
VIRLSSFWGAAPYVGYHVLNVLGPPDCSEFGECPQTAPWVTNQAIYPPIGQRLLSHGLLAFVLEANQTSGTLAVEYPVMFKPDPTGELKPCNFEWSSDARTYPDDCVPSNGSLTPRREVVPRGSVEKISAGVWCPLRRGNEGNRTLSGTGAFGPEYRFLHNHIDSYPPFTEFIEAGLATPVYLVGVELGSPRGMGAIVAISARQAASSDWLPLYADKPLLGQYREHTRQKRYWRWSAPQMCRPHVLISELRLEFDTSAETGVDDWNYLDYVKVYGSETLRSGQIPNGMTHIIYVPEADAVGSDVFTFQAADCPGVRLRHSEVASVSLTIVPVNDAPKSEATIVTLPFGQSSILFQLPVNDADGSPETLTAEIHSLPDQGVLSIQHHLTTEGINRLPFPLERGVFEQLSYSVAGLHVRTTEQAAAPRFRYVDSNMTFRVQDADGASSLLWLVLRSVACSPGYGIGFSENFTTSCVPCEPDTFSGFDGNIPAFAQLCERCPSGMHQPNVGQTQCVRVSRGLAEVRLGVLLAMFGTEASGYAEVTWAPRVGVYQALREINDKSDGVADGLLPNTQGFALRTATTSVTAQSDCRLRCNWR